MENSVVKLENITCYYSSKSPNDLIFKEDSIMYPRYDIQRKFGQSDPSIDTLYVWDVAIIITNKSEKKKYFARLEMEMIKGKITIFRSLVDWLAPKKLSVKYDHPIVLDVIRGILLSSSAAFIKKTFVQGSPDKPCYVPDTGRNWVNWLSQKPIIHVYKLNDGSPVDKSDDLGFLLNKFV